MNTYIPAGPVLLETKAKPSPQMAKQKTTTEPGSKVCTIQSEDGANPHFVPIIIGVDSCYLRIFLRKAWILGPCNNPGIAQTNLVCFAKSASFAPRSNLEETQTFLTFAWSSQASRLFAIVKGAACRSWLQVCLCEFREARRRGSLVPRHSVR